MQRTFFEKTLIVIFIVFITAGCFCLPGCGGSSGGSNNLPIADAGDDLTIGVNSYLVLDGSGSTDAENAPLSYSWSIASKPEGSEAGLTGSSAVDPAFRADVAGEFVLELIVSDGSRQSIVDTVTITATERPIADAGTDRTVVVNVLVSLDGSSSSDAEDDTLSYTWTFESKPEGSEAVLLDATLVKPEFTPDLAGEYRLSLVVSDGTEKSAKAVIVINATTKLIADAGKDRIVGVNTLVLLDGSGSRDLDSDPLTYSWSITASPSGSDPTLAGATSIDPGFVPDIAGSYEIGLVVSDGEFESTIDTVSITATERPIADAGSDRTVVVNVLISLDGSSSSDADDDTLSYTWTFESKPEGSDAALSDATLVKPEFTPDFAGEYRLSLVVSDGTEESAKAVIIINATTKPVADAGEDRIVGVNNLVLLDGSGSSDSDSDPLTYSWSITDSPSGSDPTLTGATSIDPGFVPDIAGSYEIGLVVSDGEFESTTDTVTITSTERPIADAGSDRTVVVNVLISLDGSSSSDAECDPLSYTWTLESKPEGSDAALSDATLVKPEFTPDLAGEYRLSLVVSDGTEESAKATIVISATTKPVADAGEDRIVGVNTLVILDGSGSSDSDSDPLTYSWSITDSPSGSDPTLTGATSIDPGFVPDIAGSYKIGLVVSDGEFESTTDTVTITATERPIADAGTDRTVVVNVLISLDGSSSSDADDDTLSYTWTLESKPYGSEAVLSDATLVKPEFTPDLAGEYRLSLVVSDGTEESAKAVIVISATTKPVADAGEDRIVGVNALVILDGSGSSDSDSDPLTYSWSITDSPSGSDPTLTGATSIDPGFVPDITGSYKIGLVVSDGEFESRTDTVTITATERPIADAGNDRKVVFGSTITLDGSGSSNSITGSLSYSWSFVSKPDGSSADFTEETKNTATPSFTANFAGPYVIELIVVNDITESTHDTVVVDVLPDTDGFGMTFKAIAPGTFLMGSPKSEDGRGDNETQHQVTLTKAFDMQTTEVTQGQWKSVLDQAEALDIPTGGLSKTPSNFSNCPTCPVEKVSWNDVKAFIDILNQLGEGIYRLPGEAEWEYACRAGSTTAYADLNSDLMGWYLVDEYPIPHPVAQKAPNAWGLYDMHGNASEWCEDWYGAYPTDDVTDPVGPLTGSLRVNRGGSWNDSASFCRSANRDYYSPGNWFYGLGFRLSRTP